MTIVVALLATPEGEAAVAEAIRVGRLRQARVEIVPLDEAAAQRAAQLVDGGEQGGTNVQIGISPTLRDTDLVDGFLARADELDAELIVIGLRKRSTVGKLILGSNAQRILLDAPVPVLTVKPDGDRPRG